MSGIAELSHCWGEYKAILKMFWEEIDEMRRKYRMMCWTGILLGAALFAAGCEKTSAGETDPVENQSVAAESEGNEAEREEETSAAETGFPSQMPSFTAKDLDGNTVTEDIFGEKDLTVVNIWGTFCSPCVAEMPELGEWAASMPDNVQIVGLIADISGDEDTKHHDLAVAITEKAGAQFTHIIANADFEPVMRWVVGVPTTLCVDKEGNLVGEPSVGAYVDGYKTFVEEYLNGL